MRRNFCLIILGVSVAGISATVSAGDRGPVIRMSQKSGGKSEAAPPAKRETDNWRYRYQNGRWWYWTDESGWLRYDGGRWSPPAGSSAPAARLPAAGPLETDSLDTVGERQAMAAPQSFQNWFNAYRNFNTGQAALQTAEQGGVEMGTGEITAESPAGEVYEYGGIPGRQVQRQRPVTSGAISGGGAWFNSGSPSGIKYGYGSGYGYGGYGFDNPYGYGSRSGSGGAYGYGFAAFGSVGCQTGERLSSLITGGAEPRLIGPEPPGIGAPAKLESTVGGTVGKAGLGARTLGGSAAGGD